MQPDKSMENATATGTTETTILLVEDEDVVRKLALRILRKEGYTVYSAASGAEALEICEQRGGDIHLLLTDVNMPKMGGRELARRVASVCPGIPVLYMTGSVRLPAEADDPLHKASVIEKPFGPATLADAVRSALTLASVRELPKTG